MPDEPIRVSSTAWTGLPADPPTSASTSASPGSPGESPSPTLPKSKPVTTPQAIASALFLIVIGAYGSWQAITTGEASCLHCDTFTAAEDPVEYGFAVLVLELCVPAGLLMLVVEIVGVWRRWRKRDLSRADVTRSGHSDGI